eukprot:533084-Pelagomonas_calceolata.AAC.1
MKEDTCLLLHRVTRVTRGVGLQPQNLADRLLKSIDLKISQNVKLAKKGIKSVFGSWAKLTQLSAIAIEKNMFLVLDFSTSTYITNI